MTVLYFFRRIGMVLMMTLSFGLSLSPRPAAAQTDDTVPCVPPQALNNDAQPDSTPEATADAPSQSTTTDVTSPPPSLDLRPLRTEDGSPIVYFTFDDGPFPPYTVQVLDLFAQYGGHATFFVMGRQVDQFPELVCREVQEGHYVGDHSYSHPHLTGLSTEELTRELETTRAGIAQAIGGDPHQGLYMRPPFGSVDDALIAFSAQNGFTIALWTLDTQDWNNLTSDQIVERVRGGLAPGAIILMHDGGANRSTTVAALEILLPEIVEQGYVLKSLAF
ncbi:MAG: polysaccharide deacetylase family protein [Anaerolineae bacterium]